MEYWNIFGWVLGQRFCDEFIAIIKTCYTVLELNLKIMKSERRQSIKSCLYLGARAIDRIAR